MGNRLDKEVAECQIEDLTPGVPFFAGAMPVARCPPGSHFNVSAGHKSARQQSRACLTLELHVQLCRYPTLLRSVSLTLYYCI